MKLQPGTAVTPNVRLEQPIAQGAMGSVWLAEHLTLNTKVAVKFISDRLDPDDPEVLERFIREASTAAQIKSSHVVQTFDQGVMRDGTPYIVMEYLEGEELRERLDRDGQLPLDMLQKVVAQTAKALGMAHKAGIIHRDIKPENIFLSRGVLGEMAQVLDFGLAKSATSFDGGLTKAGTVLGTPRYIAPEQARGEQVSFPADVYSFGLVMAEMITGEPVVKGTDDVQIYIQQGSDKPLVLDPRVKDGPFGAIVERSIAKDPSIRYRQASQMLADVRVAAENLGSAEASMSEAELEATTMLDPSMALQLSAPTEMSEKLRAAFNKAHKGPAQPASPPSPQPQPVPAARDARMPETMPQPPAPVQSEPPAPNPAPAPRPTPMVTTPTPPPVAAPGYQPLSTPTSVPPTSIPPSSAAPAKRSWTGVVLTILVVLILLLAGAAIALTRARRTGSEGQPVPSGSWSIVCQPRA